MTYRVEAGRVTNTSWFKNIATAIYHEDVPTNLMCELAKYNGLLKYDVQTCYLEFNSKEEATMFLIRWA